MVRAKNLKNTRQKSQHALVVIGQGVADCDPDYNRSAIRHSPPVRTTPIPGPRASGIVWNDRAAKREGLSLF